MKFQSILSIALASTLVISGSAFAGQVLTQGKTPSTNTIHTVQVTNTGSEDVYANATITVGYLNNGTCYPLQSIPVDKPFKFGAGTESNVTLDGDGLWQNVPNPLNYNCGSLTFQTPNQTTVDHFDLFNNGSTYTGTNPSFYQMTVN